MVWDVAAGAWFFVESLKISGYCSVGGMDWPQTEGLHILVCSLDRHSAGSSSGCEYSREHHSVIEQVGPNT